MAEKIKPIDTIYNGYRFRSRLEARWAVFFDTLGIKWEYEKEGFDLGEKFGYYLPDFYLPKLSIPTWIEIKSDSKIPNEELKKFKAFHDIVSYRPKTERAYILRGNPWPEEYHLDFLEKWARCPLCGRIDIMSVGTPDKKTKDVDSCYCYWCDIVDRNTGSNEHAFFHEGNVVSTGESPILRHPKLLKAFQAARSARFEHGDKWKMH